MAGNLALNVSHSAYAEIVFAGSYFILNQNHLAKESLSVGECATITRRILTDLTKSRNN
jgi:hypothetical protein